MTKWKSNDFLYVKLRTRLDTILPATKLLQKSTYPGGSFPPESVAGLDRNMHFGPNLKKKITSHPV